MKKILLHMLIYFFIVFSAIFSLALCISLTENQAFTIFLAAAIIFLFIALYKRKVANKKNDPSKEKVKISNPQKSKRIFITPIGTTILLCSLCAIYINQSTTQIPESLIAFSEKYPEASGFVNDYPKKHNKKTNMDVSNELHQGSIPLFIQWDERWGYKTYGNDYLALTGCGPTSLSMVVCGLTNNSKWTPYEVALFAEQQGYYVPDVGSSWDLMTSGAKQLGLNACPGDVSTDFILENLTSSSPIICSMYPGDFTYTGHFIVLTGVDSEGKIIVNDPNSKVNSEKHWNINEILPQIRSLWIFSFPT